MCFSGRRGHDVIRITWENMVAPITELSAGPVGRDRTKRNASKFHTDTMAFVLPASHSPLLLLKGPSMVWRWLRAAMERVGIYLPFAGVICVDGKQTISIDEEWRASITTKRRLVFIEPPSAGDLRDTYGLGFGRPTSSVIYSSPDAVELGREERTPGSVTLYWWPRDPVDLYTLYEHENGWRPTTTFNGSALCVEYRCDMRTGAFTIECVAPTPFETAVVFKRPRWPRQLTARSVIDCALKRLQTTVDAPRILDDGKRIECDIRGSSVGQRYIFVAFRKYGVADCEQWLQDTSMLGRARRTVDGWTQALSG